MFNIVRMGNRSVSREIIKGTSIGFKPILKKKTSTEDDMAKKQLMGLKKAYSMMSRLPT